jgi:hypothetical protein
VESYDDLAQRQFGLVTYQQAVGWLGRAAFRRALTAGQLVAVQAGVYRLVGTTPTFRQRALAACLACGSPVAVSHRSAAFLWGYEAVAVGPQIEVSVPRSRSSRRPGLQVHRVDFADSDIVQRHGIPVTCAGRTLLDLAAILELPALERCIDDAVRARQATPDEMIEWLGDRGRRGSDGVVRLRRLLEHRVASGVGDSVGVDRVYRWITRAGLPVPVLGLSVVIANRPRLIDIGYLRQKVAIEFNGWEFHQMRSRMDADHIRTAELQLAGWVVLVVTSAHGEKETIDRIRRALAGAPRAVGQATDAP